MRKKEWYNPEKRKAKYEKEREIKEKVHKKIFDAQKNNQEDELYATDQEVKKFIRWENYEFEYNKKYYKENAERIKEKYESTKRLRSFKISECKSIPPISITLCADLPRFKIPPLLHENVTLSNLATVSSYEEMLVLPPNM